MKRRTNTFFAILFGVLMLGICVLARQIGSTAKNKPGEQPTSKDIEEVDSANRTDTGDYYLFIARQSGCNRAMLRLLAQRPA